MNKSRIIILEGPDGVGKSTIGRWIARFTGFPYFKNSKERIQKVHGDTRALTEFMVPFMLDYWKQVPTNVIMDRFYPSEFVYGQVENRNVDLQLLADIDRECATLNPLLLIFYKSAYYNEYNDQTTPFEKIKAIREKYDEFFHYTRIRNKFMFDTSREDLDQQIEEVTKYLEYSGITLR